MKIRVNNFIIIYEITTEITVLLFILY